MKEDTAVIVLSGLTAEEKARVIQEAIKICARHELKLIAPKHLLPQPPKE